MRKALNEKGIPFRYSREDGCASLDFLWKGLNYRVWEYHEGDVWGAETNVFETGRSRDIEGDYDGIIAAEIRSWPESEYTVKR